MRLYFFLMVLSAASIASAQEIPRRTGEALDTWSEPNPGVRYLRRTSAAPAESIHAVIVDLSHPGVRVVATPQSERWSTVTEFARTTDAAVAVNGGFWGMWQRPTGVTAGGGEVWDNAEPDPEFGHFGVRSDGRAVIHGPGEGEDPSALERLSDAVSGRPLLVVDGELAVGELDTFASANQRQPRTAVGVSSDGRTVILVVVDGRQSHSRGLTLYELARLMMELGASRAINLDGGGSSAMYVAGAGGLVSSPSRSRFASVLGLETTQRRRVRTRGGERDAIVRGVEREVMNHLAVIAPASSTEVQGYEDVLADGLGGETTPAATFVESNEAPVRIGRVRELVYPGIGLAFPMIVLAIALVIWRRRRARRSIEQVEYGIFVPCHSDRSAFGRSRSPVSSFRGENS